jgi:DNA-binding response OmpR family regulator
MNKPSPSFVVLLVEDESSDAVLVRWAFNKNQIQVDFRHLTDGYDALDFLQRATLTHQDAPRPDLILLDLNMPSMSGLELLTKIKMLPVLASIPVVILSTSYAMPDVVASRNLGAADYFTKPMDIHQLVDTIRIVCERWVAPQLLIKQASGGE